MERKGRTISITGVVAIIGALALNGSKLVEFANGTWKFLLNLSATAPMGLASFLLALAFGMLLRPALQKHLPPCPDHPTRREAVIDFSGIVVGFVVMFAQLPTFFGVLLGILVGLLAPQLAKLIALLWGIAK